MIMRSTSANIYIILNVAMNIALILNCQNQMYISICLFVVKIMKWNVESKCALQK